MAQTINTNIASLNAQRNLNTSQTALVRLAAAPVLGPAHQQRQRRCRRAGDFRAYDHPDSRPEPGRPATPTTAFPSPRPAEGALAEIGNNLQRIRELAVQSAQRDQLRPRIARPSTPKSHQLKAEIDRIANQTTVQRPEAAGRHLHGANFPGRRQRQHQIDFHDGHRVPTTNRLGQQFGQGWCNATVAAGTPVTTNRQPRFRRQTLSQRDAYHLRHTRNAACGRHRRGLGLHSWRNSINVKARRLALARAYNSATLGTLSAAGTVTITLGSGASTATISATASDDRSQRAQYRNATRWPARRVLPPQFAVAAR